MTPEKAFETGARVHLRAARMHVDRYGSFLAGVVSRGSHEDYCLDEHVVLSYTRAMIDTDVYLLRTGFTAFVDSWDDPESP